MVSQLAHGKANTAHESGERGKVNPMTVRAKAARMIAAEEVSWQGVGLAAERYSLHSH